MLLSQIDENNLEVNNINKILFDIPVDDGLKGECIWVFGSKIIFYAKNGYIDDKEIILD